MEGALTLVRCEWERGWLPQTHTWPEQALGGNMERTVQLQMRRSVGFRTRGVI